MTEQMNDLPRGFKAFALLEIMLALIVMGIVSGVGIRGAAAYKNYQAQKTTAERVSMISRACALYVSQYSTNNGFSILPTPGSSQMGTVYKGPVPTNELGLPPEYAKDGWGHAITYIVPKGTEPAPFIFKSNTLLTVNGAKQNSPFVVVLIIHGPHGKGAHMPIGGFFLENELTPTEKNNIANDQPALIDTPSHKIHSFTIHYLQMLFPSNRNQEPTLQTPMHPASAFPFNPVNDLPPIDLSQTLSNNA